MIPRHFVSICALIADGRGDAGIRAERAEAAVREAHAAERPQVILHEDHSMPIVAVEHVVPCRLRATSGPGAPGSPTCSSTSCSWARRTCPEGSSTSGSKPSGADNNGTTDDDRTNYYEELPVQRAAARALARRGPHGLAAAAHGPGEARPAARRGEERAPAELRQRALRPRERDDLRQRCFRRDHPYSLAADRLDDGPVGGVARRREAVLPHVLRAEQRDALDRRRLPARFRRGAG